jgi:hypothetical protein
LNIFAMEGEWGRKHESSMASEGKAIKGISSASSDLNNESRMGFGCDRLDFG